MFPRKVHDFFSQRYQIPFRMIPQQEIIPFITVSVEDAHGSRRTYSRERNSCGLRTPLPRIREQSVCNSPKRKLQRPVFNLRLWNQFFRYEHCKKEGIHMLRDLLKPNDFMAKIDLKDACFTTPVWKTVKSYLAFCGKILSGSWLASHLVWQEHARS